MVGGIKSIHKALISHYYFILLVLVLPVQLQGQGARYYVLIGESKPAPWCSVSSDFSSFMLSPKLDGEKRNKVIEVYKNRLAKSGGEIIKEEEFYVSGTDCIIVYEYVFTNDNCPSKVTKRIKTFKASSKKKAEEILERKLETSFVKDRYVSHKVLLEVQPYLEKETSMLQDIDGFLRKHYENDSTKATGKSTVTGVRG
jgi:hypothetical protein